jgi:hypothetical protein
VTGLEVRFVRREPPLAPCAAAATGEAARALVARLRRRGDLRGLRGVAGADAVVVLGEAAGLPWVEGVQYLGRDPEAPGLLLPTTLAPELPPAVLFLALARLVGEAELPLAVLAGRPGPLRLLPLGGALPLDPAALVTWEGG